MKLEAKRQAIKLRQKGYSLGEIRAELGVAKSSASLWVRDANLSKKAQEIIRSKLTKGQEMSIKAHHEITRQKNIVAREYARSLLNNIKIDRKLAQFACSLLYACEGGKGLRSTLSFTNSDPAMIATFLRWFRRGFEIDESKFRVCVHLHDYHDKEKQLNFWSKTARIPRGQFMRPHNKLHTGVNRREGYPGCVCINYYDSSMKRKLMAIAEEFIKNTGP
ncbi:MAG: hypothetical protein NTY66_02595 [Candidatus Vogelbacteria bacterium]|nr:hypothetical protein [Candidatus Vogelbacteria bacterium]